MSDVPLGGNPCVAAVPEEGCRRSPHPGLRGGPRLVHSQLQSCFPSLFQLLFKQGFSYLVPERQILPDLCKQRALPHGKGALCARLDAARQGGWCVAHPGLLHRHGGLGENEQVCTLVTELPPDTRESRTQDLCLEEVGPLIAVCVHGSFL